MEKLNFGFDEKSPREKLESPDGKYWLKLEISVKITRRDSIIVFYDTVSLKTTTNKNTIETLFGKNIAKDMAKEMLTTAVFNPGVSILMKAMSLTKIIRGVKAGNFINPSVSPSEPTNEKDWNDSLASQILDEATTKLADKISNEIQNLTKKVFFTFEKIKWEEYKEISKELQNLTKFHIDANYEEDKTDIHCLINLNEQDDILSKIVNSKLIKNMNLKLKSESGSNLYFRKKTDKDIES